jgi:uracil-DNA glycosylase
VKIALPSCWRNVLRVEMEAAYFRKLCSFIDQQRDEKVPIFPLEEEVFFAFNQTPLKQVKVVIVGQDPYHGENQAHGLCFSVRKGNKIPPSLRNIFKELETDLSCRIPNHGDLTAWTRQGIFLLNSILTVEQKSPKSHENKGWEIFTDHVIQILSDQHERIAFILWGEYAQKKKKYIDELKHLIIESPHPAAEIYTGGKAGFFGSKPFSKVNSFLSNPINWSLDDL